MPRVLLPGAVAAIISVAGCGGGNASPRATTSETRGTPATKTDTAPQAARSELQLLPLPAQAVAVCRRAQAHARFTVLCPVRLPRATRAFTAGAPPLPLVVSAGGGLLDFSYSAPAGPEGSVPVQLNAPDRFLHFVVGRANQGVPPGARPTRLGGRRGLLARATRNGSFGSAPYFDNHARFVWRERGTRYVATLHTFGERATERLLDRLLRELRPARSLHRPAPLPTGQAAIFSRPADIAVGFGAVWVGATWDLLVRGPRLLRVDPVTLHVRGLPSGRYADVHVAVGTDGLWITSAAPARSGSLLSALEARRIDPASGRVLTHTRAARPRVTLSVGDLAVGDAATWVSANRYHGGGLTPRASGTVWRIDSTSGRVTARTHVPAGAAALLVSDGAVWVAGAGTPVISRLDTRTGALTGTVRVGPRPVALASADGAIWVTDSQDDTVRRIDPSTLEVTAAIRVGRAPFGITADARGLWVAELGDGAIARIDPSTQRVAQRIRTGGDPVAVAADGHHVWVALNSDRALLRLTP